MKKLQLILITILLLSVEFFASSNSFFKKNSMIVGGAGSYFYDKYKKDNNYNSYKEHIELTINPYLAYFIYDNFALGLDLLYFKRKGRPFSYDYLSTGPTIIKFFGNSERKIHPFLSAGMGYFKANPFHIEQNFKDYIIARNFSLGIFYMISENVALSLEVYHVNLRHRYDDSIYNSNTNEFGIQIGLSTLLLK